MNSKGEFDSGEVHGIGKVQWTDGVTYEGELTDNTITGKGTYTWLDKRFVWSKKSLRVRLAGKWRFPLMTIDQCSPWHVSSMISTYTGDVLRGIRQGHGVFKSTTSPVVYDGDWVNAHRHGQV